ncbi:MAG: replicative DNA helicase [Deltaproteobacteria bacterium]|nr:replicative DNA helicase [Deltaproteobacteria bacterium]
MSIVGRNRETKDGALGGGARFRRNGENRGFNRGDQHGEQEEGAKGNIPPNDLDAERAVLGAVLLDNGVFGTVSAAVVASDFYHPGHAVIFEAMLAVNARGEPIDVVTLSSELRNRERLNAVGGMQYLGELTETTPTIANAETHGRIVADLAQVRRMIGVAHEIVARGYGERGEADSYLDYAAAQVFGVAQRRSKSTLIPLEVAVQEAFERIEKTMERGARISGTESGFRDLDELTSGMHPGQLIIIAARPAMGKTSFVMCLTANAAKSAGKPVLFFSLEMPRVELANRLLCGEANVDQSLLRSNMMTEDQMTALTQAASNIYNLPIYIDDSGELTLMDLRAKARRMKAERDLCLIVIDYLQLMKASRDGMDSREREISEISRGLKQLAKELGVPIIALSQLNRAVENRTDKRPQLSDLRESGAIEQDADTVMFIYRDEIYNKDTEDKGVAEIIIGKQRNGPTGTARLRFIRQLTKFTNLEPDGNGYGDTHVGHFGEEG